LIFNIMITILEKYKESKYLKISYGYNDSCSFEFKDYNLKGLKTILLKVLCHVVTKGYNQKIQLISIGCENYIDDCNLINFIGIINYIENYDKETIGNKISFTPINTYPMSYDTLFKEFNIKRTLDINKTDYIYCNTPGTSNVDGKAWQQLVSKLGIVRYYTKDELMSIFDDVVCDDNIKDLLVLADKFLHHIDLQYRFCNFTKIDEFTNEVTMFDKTITDDNCIDFYFKLKSMDNNQRNSVFNILKFNKSTLHYFEMFRWYDGISYENLTGKYIKLTDAETDLFCEKMLAKTPKVFELIESFNNLEEYE